LRDWKLKFYILFKTSQVFLIFNFTSHGVCFIIFSRVRIKSTLRSISEWIINFLYFFIIFDFSIRKVEKNREQKKGV
jgi:hypothetical protein